MRKWSQHFFFLVLGMLCVVSTYSILPREVRAARIDELRTQIQEREQSIKQLETEIAQYQNQLVTVGGEKQTLQGALAQLDTARAKLAKDINLTNTKIDRTKLTTVELALTIKEKELLINRNKNTIGEIFRRIDQEEQQSLLEVLLSTNSISDFFGNIDDLSKLESGIGDNVKSLQNLRTDLANEKAGYEKEEQRLLQLSRQIEDQKHLADQKRTEQNQLLAETKNKESNYKKLLADRQARKKQFAREVSDFEAQLRAEIDPNSIPKAGTKALIYPIDTAFITQRFGKTADALRLYASGTHNGIDLRATPGTPIKAAASGVVLGTGDTDTACRGASYGRWILIAHSNGLATLYGHIDLLKVSEGQAVAVGDIIAYSGSTGYATGPHLHFTVYAKSAVQISDLPSKSCPGAIFRIPVAAQNAYLDPESYL
jgi:murein DD-endopeptidase MepM/ murein hydrolase activator NlpD